MKVNENATRHDQTFWNVREKRDKMAKALPEWEDLREEAGQIKMDILTHLDHYIALFEKNATLNGVHVHHAKDAKEYNQIVLDILSAHKVKKVVKSKSMLTEECHLNENLEKNNIEVVETDLGERILQMMKLAPSHVVMPALHVHREDIMACFKEQIPEYEQFKKKYLEISGKDNVAEDDPTMLTFVARLHLRHQFETAQAGMTGANFGIADHGDVVVCTNEGNADMSTALPNLHIVSMGIEKLIPDYRAMGIFHRLLARSGTGQETTVYTSHFRGAKPGGEMHIILVDNGRRKILEMPDHIQMLKCIRCGSCMNTCPVYRRTGGYSYSYFIPGPIGINLGMAHDAKKHAKNLSACSLCCSCENVCPVKVDLASQIYRWRQMLEKIHKEKRSKKTLSRLMTFAFGKPWIYRCLCKMAPLINHLPNWMVETKANKWTIGHKMMHFPKKSFHDLWPELKNESIIVQQEYTPTVPKCEDSSKPLSFRPTTYEDKVEKFCQTTVNVSGAELKISTAPEDIETIKGRIAVAENGCIWIPQTTPDRRHLFTSEHLDIEISRKNIVNNMHEAYELIEKSIEYFKPYPFGTFISGPSKTADIEGTLVYGAQAARSVTVWLTE
ncbi:MAG: LUD domain-containing protein [Alistipes sp.]|nr:LUD domain-containing protein [Candidatus Alistipes equi]